MKAGFAQFAPILGDLESNRRTVERLVSAAAGCDLLVLPELCSSGYNFKDAAEARRFAESAHDGPFVRHLTDLSRRHQVFLVAGLPELVPDQNGGRLFNSIVLVGPAGRIGLYRKVHLFWNEKQIFAPGDLGFPVWDLDPGRLRGIEGAPLVRIGMLICFDWQFPEAWRVLALKGAEVVVHPSNLVLPGKAQRAVPVHAMLNKVFVILANRTGTERGLDFTGHSIITDPAGEILAEVGPDEESVAVVAFDPREARNKRVTPKNDLVADRRPEFYQEILQPGSPRYAGQ